MLDAPVTDAALEFLNPFEFDPWEAIGSVLPNVLNLTAFQAIRPTVQALIQALDLPVEETTPLKQQLSEIDQRIAQLTPIATDVRRAPPTPPATKRATAQPRRVNRETRHAEPGEVLDLLLAFFAGGTRWIRGRLEDNKGNRCLMGGLQYVCEQHRVDLRSMQEAERRLMQALPKRGHSSLIAFNDSSSFAEVRALILKAQELAALPAAGKERRPPRQSSRRPPPLRQWQAPVITEGNPLTEPECASLAKLEAADERKRRVLAEIELENVARAARGDFRTTYILCPKPPGHWQVEKTVKAGTTPQPIPTATGDTRSPAFAWADVAPPIPGGVSAPSQRRRGGPVMRRDPAKAIAVLNAMLEFFDGGKRWTRQLLHDDRGNRCLIGALRYVRQQQRIRGAGTEFYLRAAFLALLDDPLDEPEPGDCALMDHNDSAACYDEVRRWIVDARGIAQAELDAKRERTSTMLQPDRGVLSSPFVVASDQWTKRPATSSPP
jgi:hypothetical protein